ncbi:MAG TPA: glycosyl hydrolase [Polyangiaceae bacterium]|nr:glycosyl hydrolase [Polyangiaceae bacterium]
MSNTKGARAHQRLSTFAGIAIWAVGCSFIVDTTVPNRAASTGGGESGGDRGNAGTTSEFGGAAGSENAGAAGRGEPQNGSGGTQSGGAHAGGASSSRAGATSGGGSTASGGTAELGGMNSGAAGDADGGEVKLCFCCEGVVDGRLANWLQSGEVQCAGTWNDASAAVQEQQYTIQPESEYGSWQKLLENAIGGIFENETWAQAANGEFDARWERTVGNIEKAWKTRDQSLLNVRFAHEFNLFDSQWRVTGSDAENFKQAWRRFHGIFKSHLPNASLVWCPNDGTSGTLDLDVRNAYPGDAYVDIIAIDTYNQWPWVNDAQAFDKKLSGEYADGAPLGAESWRRFAEAHGKPFAIGEWASNGDPDSEGGGGDSPDYIERFHSWLVTHGGTGAGQIKYAVYFNNYKQFRVFPETIQPLAAEKVRELF